MTNLEMINKLTLGVDNVEKVTIDFEGTKANFSIRPLTSGELTKLKSIEKKNLVVKIGMEKGKRTKTKVTQDGADIKDIDVNTGEFNEAQAEAMYTAIAWSLSVDDEIILVDDIKNMRPGLPEAIFSEIMNISKLSEDDLTFIKSFQSDQ